MIKQGDHTTHCAVCFHEIEYHCIDAGYLGDTDVATCEECDAQYAEGYIQPPDPWTDVDVPALQVAYLKQAAASFTIDMKEDAMQQEMAEHIIKTVGIIKQ